MEIAPFEQWDTVWNLIGSWLETSPHTNYIADSQGGKGAKVHVYLPYRGGIVFYAYIVPSGLVSIFLDVKCDKISCGLQATRFSWIFYKIILLTKKAKF